jgi:hypothetical protein
MMMVTSLTVREKRNLTTLYKNVRGGTFVVFKNTVISKVVSAYHVMWTYGGDWRDSSIRQ